MYLLQKKVVFVILFRFTSKRKSLSKRIAVWFLSKRVVVCLSNKTQRNYQDPFRHARFHQIPLLQLPTKPP